MPAAFLLLGNRTTGRRAQIEAVSRSAALRHVIANSIIGIGLYQGLEFLLQKSLGESVRHTGPAVFARLQQLDSSKTYACLRIPDRARYKQKL